MRGWGPEAFERATPEFLRLVRFGLFAEAIGPTLREARELMDSPMPRENPEARIALAKAKIEAGKVLPQIRTALMLDEPDDG